MERRLEERFRSLDGFSARHSHTEREQTAAAIALGHRSIDTYDMIHADLLDGSE